MMGLATPNAPWNAHGGLLPPNPPPWDGGGGVPRVMKKNTEGYVLASRNFHIGYPSNWDENTVKNRRFRGLEACF